MPDGKNLSLNFNTSIPSGDKHTFAFSTTGDSGASKTFELAPDGIDFYHGHESELLFATKNHYNIVVEYSQPTNSFEFNYTTPLTFYSFDVGFDVALSTFPLDDVNINIGLRSISQYPFEYNYVDVYSASFGCATSIELEVDRDELQRQFNVPILTDQPEGVFELEHDIITIISGVGDDVFTNGTDTVIKSSSYDFIAAFDGVETSCSLTIDRDVIHQNIEICGVPTGTTVLREIHLTETSEQSSNEIVLTERTIDSTLIFRFDSNIASCSSLTELDPFFVHGTNTVATLEFVEQLDKTTFDLTPCTPTTIFNLGDCTSGGKNYNYDILLCPDETNPPLNSDSHNFEFDIDFFTKECGQLKVLAYHGAYSEFTIIPDVRIDSVEFAHGHTVELDVSTTAGISGQSFNGAYAVVNQFNTYPAALFDAFVDHGHNTFVDLLTIQIIRDADAYHGQTASTEVEVFKPALIDADAYHGQTCDVDVLTSPIIGVADVYHGHYADSDIKTYPSVELSGDAYHGAHSDSDLFIYTLIAPDFIHGAYSDTDLTTFKSSGIGDVDIYHGSYSGVSVSTTDTFDVEVYHGHAIQKVMLNSSTTLEPDAYHGATVDVELERVLAHELESDVYHGSYSEFNIGVTKALFPRAYHGAAVDVDIEFHPAIDIILDLYHGVYVEVDGIQNADFNTFAYHGATADFTLNVAVNFQLDPIQHGHSGEVDDLKRGASLDAEVYHGHNGFLSAFYVPEGGSIVAEAYHGHVFTPGLHALISAHIKPFPIVASQTMYDGLGGVGGINHCVIGDGCLDPIYGDNVTRLGYDPLGIEDQLIIRFDDTGDAPWNACGGVDYAFSVQFTTNPRFEATAYAGESLEVFIPLKVIPLIGNDVPLERLYTFEYWAVIRLHTFELEDINYETVSVVWDNPDDFVAFHEYYFHADFITQKFSNGFHGQFANATLSTYHPAWMTHNKPFSYGHELILDFEPTIYIRFCKGYITPNGNNVVFEFDYEDDSDCSIFLAGAGERAFAELQNNVQFEMDVYNGERVYAYLSIVPLWTLYGRGGETMFAHIYDEAKFDPTAGHGSSAQCTFYEEPYLFYSGESCEVDTLVVPGAAIRWVTETDCLPNMYVPLTEDGDIDYDALKPDENGVTHYPDVPVEYMKYRTVLLAQCITYDASQEGGQDGD